MSVELTMMAWTPQGTLGLEGTPPKAQPEMGAAIELKKWEVTVMISCTYEKKQRVSEDYIKNCEDCVNNANCQDKK